MIKEPTDEQRHIIEHYGNIVVTAKPGSGKTFTIVEKIVGILPDLPAYKGIIAISFTNKASDELKRRCKSRLSDTKQSFFGTIDKFYISQIIIPFASHIIGKIQEYKVICKDDISDQYESLDNRRGAFTTADYSLLVDGLRDGKIFLPFTGETARYILNNVPGALMYLRAKYSHIIIDEYQDCGEVQAAIFTTLVDNGLVGIAVGDPNQAIFGFANRSPQYLIELIGRSDFTHFDLSKNHRCHPSIANYSQCLFGIAENIPSEKRVFKVSVMGNEKDIALAIDNRLDKIKRKYDVNSNNQVAVLCRNNNTIALMGRFLCTPHKIFEDTILDRDESEWGRLFREILSYRFDINVYAVDYAQQLFYEEYESQKYHRALSLCQSIFSYPFEKFSMARDEMMQLADLIYPNKRSDIAIEHLDSVINDPQKLKNYVPADEHELNLMTLHKSKGLEFNIVFHMDLYKYIMPNEYASNDSQLQDLNLHYVGITRAKDVCYIMNGTQRYSKKYNDYIVAKPSPFLSLPGLNERRNEVHWD